MSVVAVGRPGALWDGDADQLHGGAGGRDRRPVRCGGMPAAWFYPDVGRIGRVDSRFVAVQGDNGRERE